MSSTLTILDVGHGSSTVIEDKDNVTIIDTGESSALIDYLESKKITQIQFLFLSHADKDHIAKALQLLTSEKFNISTIVLNSDAAKNTNIWKDLAYEIEQQDNTNKINTIIGIKAKDCFELGDNLFLQVKSPSPEIAIIGVGGETKNGEKIKANSVSLYAVIEKNGMNIIGLTGDIDEISINHFSEKIQKSIESKFLLFPHHGGKCGNITAYGKLLDYTNPEYIIFSIGSKVHNPQEDNIDLIKQRNPIPKIMCTELSNKCNTNPEKKFRCAGNITIDLEKNQLICPCEQDYFNQLQKNTIRLCK